MICSRADLGRPARSGPTGSRGILLAVSDVIWATGIAVAGSAITGVIALAGTRFAAIESTRREAQSLRAEHREADRQVRREAYAGFLANIEELDTLTSVLTPDPTLDSWTGWLWRHRTAGVALRLVESPEVREARQGWARVLGKLTPQVMAGFHNGLTITDALGVPYVAAQSEFAAAGKALADAMAADLGYLATPHQDTRA